MIRFVRFTSVITGCHIAINPAAATSVLEDLSKSGACKVFTTESGEPVTVAGSFDEVVAALETAGAPAVAPAVEVAPTDLEMAADLLDLFSRDSIVWAPIDRRLGLDDEAGWTETRSAMLALAARLRGAR